MNSIDLIENLDGMNIEELHLSENNIKSISGLSLLPCLKKLDLSKNRIQKLRGLEYVESLRFLILC
jgi:Leucine-rich repeat (LRR) protein